MSRLYDALHRAAQTGQPTATPAGDLTQFSSDHHAAAAAAGGESPDTPWGIDNTSTQVRHAAPAPRPAEKPAGGREPVRPQAVAAPRARRVQLPVVRREAREDVPIRDVLRVVATRWKFIAAVVAVSLGIAFAYNSVTTRLYEARARLLLDVDSQQVVPFRQDTRDTGRLDYYVTQLEVLRSPGLARKALEKLGVLNGDRGEAVGEAR